MSDKTDMIISPASEIAELLRAFGAVWSIDDNDGGNVTKKHGRGRKLLTPLTGAGCKITCWPHGTPAVERATKSRGLFVELNDQQYQISFYPGASLVGNNILPDNFIRVPAEAALAVWKGYMLTQYGGQGVTAALLDQVTLEDCKLDTVTMVFLWACESHADAVKLHARLYQHVKAVLDRDTRYRMQDGDRRRTARVRTDADEGETFYIDLPWGQCRVYIKSRFAKKAFCEVQDQEAATKLYERAACVVRFEIDLDVSSFRFNDGQEIFPACPARWNPQDMPADPFKIVWEEIRVALAIDDSLAKHTPGPEKIQMLEGDYRTFLETHLASGDTAAAVPDSKKRSRVIKRLRGGDFKINGYLPWVVQREQTWSSWLSARMAYEGRFRPQSDSEIAGHCLTHENVEDLAAALCAHALPAISASTGASAWH